MVYSIGCMLLRRQILNLIFLGILTVKFTLLSCISFKWTWTNNLASETANPPVKLLALIGNLAFSPSFSLSDQSRSSSGCCNLTDATRDLPHLLTLKSAINLWPSPSATHSSLLHCWLKEHLPAPGSSGINSTAGQCLVCLEPPSPSAEKFYCSTC